MYRIAGGALARERVKPSSKEGADYGVNFESVKSRLTLRLIASYNYPYKLSTLSFQKKKEKTSIYIHTKNLLTIYPT